MQRKLWRDLLPVEAGDVLDNVVFLLYDQTVKLRIFALTDGHQLAVPHETTELVLGIDLSPFAQYQLVLDDLARLIVAVLSLAWLF